MPAWPITPKQPAVCKKDPPDRLLHEKQLKKLGIRLPIVDTKGPYFRLPSASAVGGSKESCDA